MNNEFFEALEMLEKEKGISGDLLLEKIAGAIKVAVRRDYGTSDDNIYVDIDPEKGRFSVSIAKEIVEEINDPANEIQVADAMAYTKRPMVGDMVRIGLETKQFGRIAAQAAKHMIRQGIREAERGMIYSEFSSRAQELVTATVSKVDEGRGLTTVTIGKTETILPKGEQVDGEELHTGDQIKVYIVDVQNTERGPRIMISRSHPGLVKRLFEMEVPEIYDGTVEIKSVSREGGSRTKIAVWSKNPDVDAVGACIGPKGARVAAVVDELGGEKIDIVRYSENIEEFVSSALAPATVLSVEVTDPEVKACKATVPDEQLSLAIGNKGQNVRLAAKLTGYKIDIRPESGFYGEDEDDEVTAE